MTRDELYEKTIIDQLGVLNEKKRRVLVFGAGRAGWYIIKVLEYYDINVSSIIDNDKSKHGHCFDYPVTSPEKLCKSFSEAIVFIGVFNPSTAAIVESELRSKGFENSVFLMEAFLYTYFIKVVGRNCDKLIFADSIRILFQSFDEDPNESIFISRKYYVSPPVSENITQRCTLRCKDCGTLIPYYESPKSFLVDNIVNEVARFANAFDVIPEISICGGEPLLHKDVGDICKRVSRIPNIVFVNITTNGTIMPSKAQLEEFASCGVDIHQSDYEVLSKKQDKLIELLNKHCIYNDINFVNDNFMWSSGPKLFKRNRKQGENDKVFEECIASQRVCCQLMGGRLYRCAPGMSGILLGKIPNYFHDYVDLIDDSMGEEELIRSVRAFISRKTALKSCDYCDQNKPDWVKPAIQLKSEEV